MDRNMSSFEQKFWEFFGQMDLARREATASPSGRGSRRRKKRGRKGRHSSLTPVSVQKEREKIYGFIDLSDESHDLEIDEDKLPEGYEASNEFYFRYYIDVISNRVHKTEYVIPIYKNDAGDMITADIPDILTDAPITYGPNFRALWSLPPLSDFT